MPASHAHKQFVIALFTLIFATGIACAQYTITGTTAGGGNIITGNGALPALGPGSPLSGGGFDQVTINIGATGDTVTFGTANDTLINLGTVVASPGGTYGTYFGGASGTFANSGNWTYSGTGLAGVYFNGDAGSFTNTGTWSATGAAQNGVYFDGNAASFTNSGNWSYAGSGDTAAFLGGDNGAFTNTGTWNAAGNAHYGIYFNGADGSFTNTGNWTFAGNIAGVYFTGKNSSFTNTGIWNATGNATYGVFFDSAIASFTNSGNWSYAGSGDAGVNFDGKNGTFINSGVWSATGDAAIGVYFNGKADFENSGNWNYAGSGQAGVFFDGRNTTFTNSGIWKATGNAAYGVYFDGRENIFTNSGNWSYAGSGSAGVYFGNSNDVFTNSGTWTASGGAFHGVNLTGGASTFTNSGVWSYTGNHAGILFQGDNNTLTNTGAITASGNNPVAIDFEGSNNVVNLDGHSSVNGLIKAAGNANSNVLNLNFTGLSVAEIATLKAQLAADGALTGKDSSGTFTVRGVTYTYDPLVVHLNVSSYQLQGLTPNQARIGASLDSITTNPAPGSTLFNLFNTLDSSGNVSGALEAFSPQQYQAYGELAIGNATMTVQEIDARLNNLRDGSESLDTTGIGGAGDATATAGYSKDDGKESKNVVQIPAPEKRWDMFATGDGLFSRDNSHDVDAQGARANTAGTLAGVDAKIGSHFVAGALFAYDNADATLGAGGNGHATIESYTGGLYGAYHQDGFYLNSLAAYTNNRYSSDRNINIPGIGGTATGNTRGNQYTANLDGGYDWHVTNRLTMGPIAGLQYVHLDVDGFNEAGAGAASLSVGDQRMDSLQSRVGGRVDYHMLTTDHSSFAAELHAAWQHEYLDGSRSIGAGFEGLGLAPFSVQTTSPLRDAAVVGLGLNFTFHERLTLFADYELLMWRASDFEQTINGGARISF